MPLSDIIGQCFPTRWKVTTRVLIIALAVFNYLVGFIPTTSMDVSGSEATDWVPCQSLYSLTSFWDTYIASWSSTFHIVRHLFTCLCLLLFVIQCKDLLSPFCFWCPTSRRVESSLLTLEDGDFSLGCSRNIKRVRAPLMQCLHDNVAWLRISIPAFCLRNARC